MTSPISLDLDPRSSDQYTLSPSNLVQALLQSPVNENENNYEKKKNMNEEDDDEDDGM